MAQMRAAPRQLLWLLATLAVLPAMPATGLAQTATGGAAASHHDRGEGGDSYDEQYYDDGDDFYDGGAGEYDEYQYDQVTDPAASGGQEPSGTTPSTGVPPRQPAPAKPTVPVVPPVPTGPPVAYVPGKVAQLQSNGKAAIPRGAPQAVRRIIAAGNRLIGKPYKWGGGHAKLEDRGYDCSGAVSYALIGGRLLAWPMVSGGLARWGSSGAGRWVTVYANAGHVYMEVAGLRLDTSPIGDASQNKGPRWRPVIGKRPKFKVRHPAGL
jgi:hypothetical protein